MSNNSIILHLLDNADWGEYTYDIDRLKSWKHYPMCHKMLSDMQREELFVSPVHGEGHIERVFLHGAFSAMELDLSENETYLLMLMCSYHDTGRVSDWLDDDHGARSANKLERITKLDGDELKTIMAGVEAHSVGDSLMESIVLKYAPEDAEKCLLLAKLLKDADGLDRVRIDDLNTKFLRFPHSKGHAEFAEFLYKLYIAEQKRRGLPVPQKKDYFDIELLGHVRSSLHKLYFEKNYNCAMATIVVLSELLSVSINQQTLDAAICMNGAGRYRAQCGLVEGALMFMGIYFANKGLAREEINPICFGFAEKFEKQYSSLMCRDLRPGGFNEDDPPHMCAPLTIDTVLFTYEYIVSVSRKIDLK